MKKIFCSLCQKPATLVKEEKLENGAGIRYHYECHNNPGCPILWACIDLPKKETAEEKLSTIHLTYLNTRVDGADMNDAVSFLEWLGNYLGVTDKEVKDYEEGHAMANPRDDSMDDYLDVMDPSKRYRQAGNQNVFEIGGEG